MGKFILFIFISYLLGSISGSLLLGKFKNIDIRKLGSGNAGGTNALRSVGPLFAFGAIFIDILKGYLPIVLFSPYISDINIDIAQITFGVAAVLGHVYPVFYGFKGGKGAGTLLGVIIIYDPSALIYVLSTWIIFLVFSGYVGLSTIAATLILFLFSLSTSDYTLIIFSAAALFFILYNHRGNITRMRAGEENRFSSVMIFKK